MLRAWSLRGIASLALVATAGGAWAQGEGAGLGRASASSYAAIPLGVPVMVRPLDDSPDQLRIKENIASALSRRQWRVQESPAPIAFNFETEIQQIGRRPSEPSFGRASGSSSRETEVIVNMYSTTQDSIITGRQAEVRGSLRYVLTMTADDQRSGRRLWQGEASYVGSAGDDQAVLRALIPMLIDMLGQTVRQRSFSLP